MARYAVELPGAAISYDPDWLAAGAATDLFEALRRALPWERHRITVYGRSLDAPRLSCWIGDAAYTYSGTRFEPHPWPAALAPVRERLERELHAGFNSVLANLYRDGSDRLGFHRDSEPELGPEPLIASISLGATRRFLLRHRREPARRQGVELAHGSLLLMRGACQSDWRHALPRTAKPVGPRINLTFRRIVQVA